MRFLLSVATLWLALGSTCLAGDPKPVENQFVKMEVCGFAVKTDPPLGGTIQYRFMFLLKKPLTLTSVRVDDVTDKASPVLVVDDKNPKFADKHWRGNSAERRINAQNTPWIFENKDSNRLFRFTIGSKEKPEMVLNQASRFDRESKEFLLRAMKPKTKK